MTQFSDNDSSCPRCNSENLFRLRRTWWMRLVGIHKHLRCQSCRLTLLCRKRTLLKPTATEPPQTRSGKPR